ncbi:MAG: TlpA disulfide reductase family protein [Candidatus Tumulicola sp.]
MIASILIALIAAVGFAPGAAPSDIAALRQPGVTVPPITLPNIAGGTLPLRDPNGRVTVLVVFAAWCDPCRKNLPATERLAQRSRARFVGIDELESTAKARALVAEYGLTFPIVLLTTPAFDGPDVTDDQRAATGLDIPAVYVIDSRSRSFKAFVGADAAAISEIAAAITGAGHH